MEQIQDQVSVYADKIVACYMEYIHARRVLLITNPKDETMLSPIVAPLEEQTDLIPIFELAKQRCHIVHRLLVNMNIEYSENSVALQNIYRSHWFMGLLYYKMNLLDKAIEHYMETRRYFVLMEGEYFIENRGNDGLSASYACLGHFYKVMSIEDKAEHCFAKSNKYKCAEKYDRILIWDLMDSGEDYAKAQFYICKELCKQRIATEEKLISLIRHCKHAMIIYQEKKEYDKVTMFGRIACDLSKLLTESVNQIQDFDFVSVCEELSKIYGDLVSRKAELETIKKAYHTCLELHEMDTSAECLRILQSCAYEIAKYYDKSNLEDEDEDEDVGEADDEAAVEYYEQGFQFQQAYCRMVDYYWDHCIEGASIHIGYWVRKKMFNEAYKLSKNCLSLLDELRLSPDYDGFFDDKLIEVRKGLADLCNELQKPEEALEYLYWLEEHGYSYVICDIAKAKATMLLEPEDNPKVIEELRKQLHKRLLNPIDSIWHDLYIAQSKVYTLRDKGKIMGYCCIGEDKCLTQIYLHDEYLYEMSHVLNVLAHAEIIDKARLSTAYPAAFNPCLSVSYSHAAYTYCYGALGKAICPAKPKEMVLATEEDIQDVVDFYFKEAPIVDALEYVKNLVNRGELYLCKKDNVIIATGECRLRDMHPEIADLDMTLSDNKRMIDYFELGSAVLTSLIGIAKGKGRCPVCTVSADNCRMKWAAEQTGFLCSSVFFDTKI